MNAITQLTISNAFYSIALELLDKNQDFSIVVSNNNDWDKPLPERLASVEAFVMNVNGNTLEDSVINTDGTFTIVTDFDGILYTKTFSTADIQGFADDKAKPLLMKPFKEKHPLLQTKIIPKGLLPDEAGIEHSMKMFKKSNPHLFKD